MKGIKYTYAGICIMLFSLVAFIVGLYESITTKNGWYCLLGAWSWHLFIEGWHIVKNS